MKKMNVDFAKKVIEVDVKFAKKAFVFGTPQYNELADVVKLCPKFKVVTKSLNAKKTRGADLIKEQFIIDYCTACGDTEFINKINTWKKSNIDFDGCVCEYCFFTVRNKFLENHPEVKFREKNTKKDNVVENLKSVETDTCEEFVA